jgi:hypothetical protein
MLKKQQPQMEAVVTWRPTPGLRNEDVLTLSVPNGKDTEMRVNGLCAEPKVRHPTPG